MYTVRPAHTRSPTPPHTRPPNTLARQAADGRGGAAKGISNSHGVRPVHLLKEREREREREKEREREREREGERERTRLNLGGRTTRTEEGRAVLAEQAAHAHGAHAGLLLLCRGCQESCVRGCQLLPLVLEVLEELSFVCGLCGWRFITNLPWRQPRGKSLVSLVNSHPNATRMGWHLWEIDLRFAPGLPPGWSAVRKRQGCLPLPRAASLDATPTCRALTPGICRLMRAGKKDRRGAPFFFFFFFFTLVTGPRAGPCALS